MHSLPSSSQTARLPRFAAFILAAALMLAMPLHSASAADALTTTTSSSTGTSSTKTSNWQNGLLGLPIGIIKSVFTGASKVVGKAVNKHITKN
jgi:hypothetical protein